MEPRSSGVAIAKQHLIQEEDCCGRNGQHYQELIIELCDGGCGAYVVLKTKRWAIDKDDLKLFIKKLKDLINEYDKARLFE